MQLQECPEGVVHEDCFKEIYAKFFPHGSEYIKAMPRHAFIVYNPHFPLSDSSMYAHYVFRAFDVNCNGAISFRVSIALSPTNFR